MLWIPITIFAAFAQTVRNAAQRHLVTELGTLGATLVRFLYGLPFALAWLVIVAVVVGESPPAITSAVFGWALLGGVAQIAGTALLLKTMRERNFAVGVAYSKTDAVQVALFAVVLLGDPLDLRTGVAVVTATLGVLLLSPADPSRPLRSLIEGLASRSALLGIACGGCMGLSAVAFRGGTQAAASPSFLLSAATTLVVAQRCRP